MQVTDVHLEFEQQSLMSNSTNNNNNGSGNGASANMASDPFYVYKDSVEVQLKGLSSSTANYVNIVMTSNTATNAGLKEVKKKVKKETKAMEGTLTDLQYTVRLVENDRLNFNHIDDEELASRIEFITTMSNKLHSLKNEITSDKVKNKMMKDERELAISRGGNLGATNSTQQANTDFVQNQQASAAMMMRQQDETLTDLDSAVDRVHGMAGAINIELGQQNQMLDELEEDLDEAEMRMGVVMGKLGKLLKTKDGCQLWTIIGLTLLLFVLCFLVFYT